LRLWDTTTGKEEQKLGGYNVTASAVAFSPDGTTLASASYDRTMRLWNVMMGEEKQKCKEHSDSISAVAFGHNAQHNPYIQQQAPLQTP